MNTVTLSTKHSSSIDVNHKTFILFLRNPGVIEMCGYGIDNENPIIFNVLNNEDEFELDYTDEFIWSAVKEYKKNNKGMKK